MSVQFKVDFKELDNYKNKIEKLSDKGKPFMDRLTRVLAQALVESAKSWSPVRKPRDNPNDKAPYNTWERDHLKPGHPGRLKNSWHWSKTLPTIRSSPRVDWGLSKGDFGFERLGIDTKYIFKEGKVSVHGVDSLKNKDFGTSKLYVYSNARYFEFVEYGHKQHIGQYAPPIRRHLINESVEPNPFFQRANLDLMRSRKYFIQNYVQKYFNELK